ncbi:MAG: molybdenum ABC transporter ATP-binding protein [Rhodobacteraceae bacterium]|nr:molybdenum ABC transporter ATP-binding protein [Paracoccaceae bacterium]
MSVKTLRLRARLPFEDHTIEFNEGISLNGITALFGPSGSGKSTLLRIIAGFEKRGNIRLTYDNAIWTDTNARIFCPPHERPVGMVFQDDRLFSHLSVAGNLAFADKRSPKVNHPITMDQVVKSLDLLNLLNKFPATLSGGEKQRVALGRTLLTQPELLLLDEPLSALDIRRKAELLPFLEKIPREFGVPAIFVSHAIDEVARLADEVILLSPDGHVSAHGPVPAIFDTQEMHEFTGKFEAGTFLQATVIAQDTGFKITTLDFEGEVMRMPMVASLNIGDRIRLRIRARDVAVATSRPEGISIRNAIAAVISEIKAEEETAFAEILFKVGAQTLRARITRQAVDELGLKVGQDAFALIKSVSFDRRVMISALG